MAEYVVENPQSFLVNDVVVTLANNPVIIKPLSNDTFEEPEKVAITEVTPPKMGTAVINEDNTITYTPDTDQTGTDEFDYSTSVTNPDNTVTEETGSVTVTVTDKTPTPSDNDYGKLKAFPTAFGAGAFSVGGRGGKIIHVTNLNGSGPGSFVEALKTTGPRIIVFDVSGTIDLGGSQVYVSGDSRSNVTVAGQTAPKGGITVKNGNINFSGVNNSIVRYIRFRNAEMSGSTAVEQDCFTYWGGNNIIFDHCSASFGGDESISFVASDANDISNVTLQRTLIGGSKTGGIMGSSSRPTKVGDMSYIFNLNADNGHRTPNLAGNARFDVINNVVFNWDGRGSTINFDTKINQIANYYKPGANTTKWSVNDTKHKRQSGNNSIYAKENYFSGLLTGSSNENNQVIWATFSGSNPLSSNYFTNSQFALLGEPFSILSPQEAYNEVLSDVGANKYLDDNGSPQTYLDSYDQDKINNTINKISVGKLTGWIMPALPTNKRSSDYDKDSDGMADAWELANGLDPNNSSDANKDRNNDGYTNIEDFINQVDF